MISGKSIGTLTDQFLIIGSDACENTFSSEDLVELKEVKIIQANKFTQLTNSITSSNFYVLDMATPAGADGAYIELDYNIAGYTGIVNLFALYEFDQVGTSTYSWLNIAQIDTNVSTSGNLLIKNPDDIFGNKQFLSFAFVLPSFVTPTGFETVTYSAYSVDDVQIEYETCDGVETISSIETFYETNTAQNEGSGTSYFIGTTQYIDSFNVDNEYFTKKDPFNIVLPPLKSIKYIGIDKDIAFECECDETTLCDFEKITFYQNCGAVKEILLSFSVQGGTYEYVTKNFTGLNGQIVYPNVSQSAVYDLIIDSYSDSFYLDLQELIANNLYIKIKGFEYVFRKETIEPAWAELSDYAQASVKIIRKDTIKTVKRNCCGA